MPDIERYDALVLGTGEAGKYMAWHLGASGKRVAAIERKLHRRRLPKRGLPAEQERGSWSEGRLLFPERRRVRHAGRQMDRFHAGRTRTQTADGRGVFSGSTWITLPAAR